MTTFADKPWRPADHPSPGPSWHAEPKPLEASRSRDVDQVLEPPDREVLFDQGGSASSFALPPSVSTADGPDHSAGIALQRRYQVTGHEPPA